MNIYIPSRSRYAIKSLTIERMYSGYPEKKIFFVVPAKQASLYEKQLPNRGKIRVLPCPADGIARTREWIGRNSETDKFLMLDDDLRFFHRPLMRPVDDPLPGAGLPNDKPPRLYKCEREHITAMIETVDRFLDDYKHVAIGARDGNNQFPLPAVYCKRPLRALAYQREAFLSCKHGRVDVMEDFDITLQLLKRGFPNAVLTGYCQDQYQTQLEGGCSDYRTLELHEANVKRFARLNSPFVATEIKENRHGGIFKRRLEARIYWKAAYDATLEDLGLK